LKGLERENRSKLMEKEGIKREEKIRQSNSRMKQSGTEKQSNSRMKQSGTEKQRKAKKSKEK